MFVSPLKSFTMDSYQTFCDVTNLYFAAINYRILGIIGISIAALLLILFSYRRIAKKTSPSCTEKETIAPPDTELYVANMGGHSILGFNRNLSGTVVSPPVRILKGPCTGLKNPFDVAIDSSGQIWVANLGDPPGTNPSITIFEANVTGNTAPLLTVPLSGITGNLLPGSLARRSSSGSFVLAISNNDSISECSIASGATHGLILSGAQTQIINPTGIAYNANQLFVATSSLPLIFGLYQIPNPLESAILIFDLQQGGGFNPIPAAMIAGDNTGLANPAHICFDDHGKLYVANRGIPPSDNAVSITVYALGQTGNTPPVKMIHGPNTSLNQSGSPYGISVDSDGNIYVSSQNSVLFFEAVANGNATPAQVITDPEISSPIGLAVR